MRHAGRLVASIAKAYCSEAYFHVAASSIQVHGGIGFTWEHDAHLYYRRAKSAEVMLGTPASHREVVAGLLLTDAAGQGVARQLPDGGAETMERVSRVLTAARAGGYPCSSPGTCAAGISGVPSGAEMS